jgi:transglutaminase-like putative cysteine protease
MLASHVAAIIPHISHLPPWLVVLSLGCVGWRVMVYQGRWHFPGRWIRAAMVALGGVGIIVAYQGKLSSEAGVALLVMSFSLKLLEMYRRRDAYLQVMLAYFVICPSLLFNTSMLSFLYLCVVFMMVTAALIGLNQTRTHLHPFRAFRLSALIFLQALPIIVALFLFFPRMSPIWALSVSTDERLPGLQESMTPADIVELAGRSALAFRATFEGAPPQYSELYWRAIVFSHFDGKTWSLWHSGPISQSGQFRQQKRPALKYIGRRYDYTVMMQPTQQRYLVSLDMPIPGQLDATLTDDFRLVAAEPLREVYQYRAVSYLDYRAGEQLTGLALAQTLQLPERGNPRARALAQRWLRDVGGDRSQYVKKVLAYFREEPFYYTLKPPKLHDNIVDRFLLDTRRGYCAHYAGAFVFMLRAAGIPSRVVGGYLGGEINLIGRYVSVHQFEAHAWAELWLPGKGWRRVDPTSEVAPARVLDSVQDALREEGSFLESEPLSSVGFRGNPLMRGVRHAIDYANYSWNSHVVGYDQARQKDFLDNYFSSISPQLIAIFVILLVVLISMAVALIMFNVRPSVALSEMDLLYRRFQSYLRALGVSRAVGETPEQFQARAVSRLPHLEQTISRFTQTYVAQQYLPKSQVGQTRARAVNALKKDLRVLQGSVVRRRSRVMRFFDRFLFRRG